MLALMLRLLMVAGALGLLAWGAAAVRGAWRGERRVRLECPICGLGLDFVPARKGPACLTRRATCPRCGAHLGPSLRRLTGNGRLAVPSDLRFAARAFNHELTVATARPRLNLAGRRGGSGRL